MSRLLLLAVLVAGVAAACTGGEGDSFSSAPTVSVPSPTQAAGGCTGERPSEPDARHTVSSGRIERSYLLHLPPAYDGRTPAPLLIAFHGYGSNPEQMQQMTGLNEAADAAGMVTVFPSGTGQNLAWNIEQLPNAPNDVTFVEDLLKTLERYFCIDAQRIYVAGFSNGGAMAYLAACLLPEKFAAAAVVAGYTGCRADVPLIAFHGTADPTIPYDGSNALGGGGPDFLPVRDAVTGWATANGCQPDPATTEPAAGIELSTFAGCGGGDGDVLLYSVDGGGHTWPGSRIEIPDAGATTQAISATQLIMAFFEKHKQSQRP